MPTKTISHLMSPERRVRTIKMMAISMMRVFAAFLLVIGIRLRRDMKRDAQRKH